MDAGKEELEPGRDRRGRFTKGNKFTPPTVGRKKVKRYYDVNDLEVMLEQDYPPEFFVEQYRLLFDDPNLTPKQRLAALESLLNRLYGKPVTRQISANLDMDKFRQLFMDHGDGDGNDGDVIDGEIIDEEENSHAP